MSVDIESQGAHIDELTEGMTQFTRALVRNQIRRAIRFGVERDEMMSGVDHLDQKIGAIDSCPDENCKGCPWHAIMWEYERLYKKYDYLTKMLGGRQ